MTEQLNREKPIGDYFKFMDERRIFNNNINIKLEGHRDPLRRIITNLPSKKEPEHIKQKSLSLSKQIMYVINYLEKILYKKMINLHINEKL
jgi:hypothetical protein